ncbi:MAG: hypothetical protein OEY59_00120 [Deltaproteobacteria bacterium]|nr:hypothetical protein [Deltaproteobacteria bacterium]
MIFPTEQPSNSFYIGKTKYFSKKGFILRDVIEAPEGYVYSGETENQKKTMGYFGKLEAEFTELEGGFFQLKKDSLSKLYRNYPGDKIQELLPRSNTAAGLVYNGHDRAVFFHIANGKSIETEDGKMKYLYTFKIHLTDIKTPNIKTISPQIDDFDPILKLNWLKRNVVQYILSDGQKFQINVD